MLISCGSIKSSLKSGLSLNNFWSVSQVNSGSLDRDNWGWDWEGFRSKGSMFTSCSSFKSSLARDLSGRDLGSVFNRYNWSMSYVDYRSNVVDYRGNMVDNRGNM